MTKRDTMPSCEFEVTTRALLDTPEALALTAHDWRYLYHTIRSTMRNRHETNAAHERMAKLIAECEEELKRA